LDNYDAPPNSSSDSNATLKVKTIEEGVKICSLVCKISRVKECAGALGWELR
jgi:hypothetical protein